MSQFLTVKSVAARFNVSADTVKRWIKRGDLRAYQIAPRALRIRAQDVPEQAPANPSRKRPTNLPDGGVYMLFLDGALIYVGRSTELPRRITNHRRAGRSFHEVRAIPCDYETAKWLEAELVRTLQPTENIKRFVRRARRIEEALVL